MSLAKVILTSILALALFSWVSCDSINPKRQEIFDKLIAQMTQATGCVDHDQFFQNLYQTLSKESIIQEITQVQKWIFDQMIKKYNIQRKWYSIDHHSHQICILSKQSSNLYNPIKGSKSLELSVKQTVAQYPYLKDNMQHQRITKLLMALPTFFRQTFQVRRYTIINKKLYVQSFEQDLNPNHYGKYLITLLNDLPDIDFIMIGKYELSQIQLIDYALKNSRSPQQYIAKVEWYKRILIELPIFLMQKNVSNNIQFNKFLVPRSQFLDGDWWNGLVKKVDQGAQLYKWEDKIEVSYYRSQQTGLMEVDDLIQNEVSTNFTKQYLSNISKHNQDLLKMEFAGEQPQQSHMISDKDFHFIEENSWQTFVKNMQKYKYLISLGQQFTKIQKTALILRSSSILFQQVGQKVMWYFDKLIPNHHYIALSQTFDDILDKVRYMRQNDNLAKQIVANANKFFKQYLTTQGSSAHLVQILKDYAQIQQLNLGYFQRKLYTQNNMVRMQDRRQIFQNYYSYLFSTIVVVILCLFSVLILFISPLGRSIENVLGKNKNKSQFTDGYLKDKPQGQVFLSNK